MMYELVYRTFNHQLDDQIELFIRSDKEEDCLKIAEQYVIPLKPKHLYKEIVEGFFIREIPSISFDKDKEERLNYLLNKYEKEMENIRKLKEMKIFDFGINQLVDMKVDK